MRAAPSKKVTFQWGDVRFHDSDIFPKNCAAGRSFYVMGKQARVRMDGVTVHGREKMLTKVRWTLGEVSL